MIVKHFGVDWDYVKQEIPWYEYYILLAAALDLDERDQFWDYVLTGSDPKKFPWGSPDRAGTRPQDSRRMWAKVVQKFGKGMARGDIADVAESWGLKRIQRIETKYPDGRVEVKFKDAETGQEIQRDKAEVFLRSRKLTKQLESEQGR